MSYTERLDLVNLLEIYDIVLFYNLYHNRLNVNIEQYFTLEPETIRRGRSASNTVNFVQRKYYTEPCGSFFNNRVLHLWNLLPQNIKVYGNEGIISTFKKVLF